MKQEQIQALLDRYLDGATTNEEEALLRHYFSVTQLVPPEWRPYRAIFAWEAREARHARSVCCDSIATKSPRRLAIAAGIAALVLAGAGLAYTLLRQPAAGQMEAKHYAIIDGHYTTDITLVNQAAEQALQMVATTEEDTFDALNILEL